MILWYSDKRIMTQYHNITLNVILWYSIEIVLVECHNITISRRCDIVIFYQRASSRMSQYHNIMWMWYCDIWLKLLDQKGNILDKVLYFYVILWYSDKRIMTQYHNITLNVIFWYSIKMVLVESHNITISPGCDIVIFY